jgi:hypothetical protein
MATNNRKPNNNKKVIKPVKDEKAKLPPVPPRNEIPMYDPQTGEPNPHYEELTGKKNPLLEIRKTTRSSPSVLPHFEPKKQNRFRVSLPQHFAIPEYCVAKTSRPKMVTKIKKSLLGSGVEHVWENITFEFYDPIVVSVSESLLKIVEEWMEEPFKYTLEMLDPTGKAIETYEIGDCEIVSVDLGDLGYGLDGIATCTMTIKPGYVKLKK